MNGAELILMDCQSDTAAQTVEGVRLSFDEAFVAHHRVVYRYAYALTRDPGLAEDVAQEVFVRLHQHLDASQRDGLLRAWLLRVTANVSRNSDSDRHESTARDGDAMSFDRRTASGRAGSGLLHPHNSFR
jgi:DNA-directed RNA polymerase specialized sigma24 family protein